MITIRCAQPPVAVYYQRIRTAVVERKYSVQTLCIIGTKNYIRFWNRTNRSVLGNENRQGGNNNKIDYKIETVFIVNRLHSHKIFGCLIDKPVHYRSLLQIQFSPFATFHLDRARKSIIRGSFRELFDSQLSIELPKFGTARYRSTNPCRVRAFLFFFFTFLLQPLNSVYRMNNFFRFVELCVVFINCIGNTMPFVCSRTRTNTLIYIDDAELFACKSYGKCRIIFTADVKNRGGTRRFLLLQ